MPVGNNDDPEPQVIYDLAKNCDEWFSKYSSALTQRHEEARQGYLMLIVQDHRERFWAWVKDIGVYAEPLLSLDNRLADHPKVRDMVLLLLNLISVNLQEAVRSCQDMSPDVMSRSEISSEVELSGSSEYVTHPEQALDSFHTSKFNQVSEHGESNSHSVWGLRQDVAQHAVEESLKRLNQLSVAIRRSSKTSLANKVQNDIDQDKTGITKFKALANQILQHLYPNINSGLKDQLSHSMTFRRARILRQQHRQQALHAERITNDATESSGIMEAEVLNVTPRPTKAVSQAELQNVKQQNRSTETSRLEQSVVVSQKATTLDESAYEKYINSEPSQSEDGRSSVSSAWMGDFDWPQPPRILKGEKFTVCPICLQLFPSKRFGRKRWWRRHARQDIQFFNCISQDCRSPPRYFTSRSMWISHMRICHSQDWLQDIHPVYHWYCAMEHSKPTGFKNRESYQKHLHDFHSDEYDVLNHTDQSLFLDCGRISESRSTEMCPICGTTLNQMLLPDNKTPQTEQPSNDMMEKHIGDHLMVFSRMSLLDMVLEPDDVPEDTGASKEPHADDAANIDHERDETMSRLSFDSTPSRNELESIGTNGTGHEDVLAIAPDDGEVYKEPHLDDVLVIGIDFGTTYSGVAWSTAADFARNEINVVSSWPGSGRQEAKVPTALFYENGEVMWGYDIPLDVDPARWFKLLLVKEEDLGKELRNSEPLVYARKCVDDTAKKPVELVADYLRALFEHTLNVIRKARGQSVVDALRFHVVITVPAIWQDYARRDMEQAAEMAGIMGSRPAGQTKLTFAPEPEAAALSTLYEMGRNLNKGDVFIICDAGGGIVDLISYEVTNSKPLVIDEVGEGTGGICGGVFIDEAFEKAYRDRLGRKWGRLSPVDIRDIMRNEWEVAIKSQFKPDSRRSNREYIVGIPPEVSRATSESFDDPNKQPMIKNGRIHFQQSHIKEMFAGSLNVIDKLVNNQIRMVLKEGLKVAGIVLVGGLGTSPYLYEHLKDKHSTSNVSEILQSGGIKPRTAICRGAIYKGFLEKPSGTIIPPIEVTSTVSRYSYGIKYVTEYNAAQHLPEDKMWDGSQWCARNQIKWYLKRGAVVPKSPVRYSFYEYIKDADDFDGTLNITLLVCEELDPPDREDYRVNAKCKFQLIVTTPYSELPDFRTADGTMVKKLGYEIGMIPSGASLDFAVYIDGKELMSQNTSYTSVRF